MHILKLLNLLQDHICWAFGLTDSQLALHIVQSQKQLQTYHYNGYVLNKIKQNSSGMKRYMKYILEFINFHWKKPNFYKHVAILFYRTSLFDLEQKKWKWKKSHVNFQYLEAFFIVSNKMSVCWRKTNRKGCCHKNYF